MRCYVAFSTNTVPSNEHKGFANEGDKLIPFMRTRYTPSRIKGCSAIAFS